MANENWNIVTEDKQVSIEDVLKNSWDLSTRSNEDLTSFLAEYKKGDDYGAIAALATELDHRTKVETVTVDPEVSKQLAEEAANKEESNKEFNSKLDGEKKEIKKVNEEKISELTAKLEGALQKMSEMEEKYNKLVEKNRNDTSESLEWTLDAKKSWDSEKLKAAKEENEKLIKEKKALEAKYKVELFKYPPEEIATMKTKLIKWRWISKKTITTEDWTETTIKRPSIKINKHRRSRRKLNQVVKAFNWFKKDSDNAVKYILTQERSDRVSHIIWDTAGVQMMNRGRYNLMHKTWFVMSKAKFEEKFDKQQEKLIDKFKKNIDPVEWSAEATTIKWLEDRFKRYKQDYMNKHY